MTADFAQRLRTCSTEERRDVAIQLARTRSDEAIAELINMVEGAVRISRTIETRLHEIPYKPHWWSRTRMKQEPYQFDPSEHYGLHDQIVAIEALGITGSIKALNFLRVLSVHSPPEQEYEEGSYGGSSGDYGTQQWPTGNYKDATFPNAKGELGWKLGSARAAVEVCRFHGLDEDPKNEYVVLKSAIRKLEKDFQTAPLNS